MTSSGHAPLLVLPPERIARELEHARRAEAQMRHYRRRLRRLIGVCAAEVVAGYAAGMMMFRVSSPEAGQAWYSIGTFATIAVPLLTLVLWLWAEGQR